MCDVRWMKGGCRRVAFSLDAIWYEAYPAGVLSSDSAASAPVTQEIRRLPARVAKSREVASH